MTRTAEDVTDLSFHEKSLWPMFVSLVGIFGFYLRDGAADGCDERYAVSGVLFVLVVVTLVIMQIVAHIVIAIVDGVRRRTSGPG